MEGMEGMEGATEEVWLPGPDGEPDGEGPYDFAYPRMGRLLKMQRTLPNLTDVQAVKESGRAQTDWLSKGFGPEAWAHIVERMDDEDDILDDEHMQWLFVQLQKANTGGRPTTSSNGASRQPWKKPSTAAPLRQVSDSEN
jgi:hypothetical protein